MKGSDTMIGGSMNLDGAIELRVTTVGSAGTLAQMMRLMEQAQSAKAPMQRTGQGGGDKAHWGKNSCKGQGACATDGSKPPKS